MKKLLFSVVTVLLTSVTLHAQVGIGTVTPEAPLDVVSTNGGILVPRVANTTEVTNPINGLIIYDLSESCFKGFGNNAWSDCFVAPTVLTSADVLMQIGNEGDDPDVTSSVVTVPQLELITPDLTDLIAANEAAYRDYIDAYPSLFSSPAATQVEVQNMVTAVNASVVESDSVLTLIGGDAVDGTATSSAVTIAQLNSIIPTVNDIDPTNETAYQEYIDNNPGLFSSPAATQVEVQNMIDTVNSNVVLAQIGKEADGANSVTSVVTVSAIKRIRPEVTGVNAANEAAYQDYIDNYPGLFSDPATQKEVQDMVTAVNLASRPPVSYCASSPTTVVEVPGAGGATWMDRNLGATQVAGSNTDADAIGDLYQWGRFTDGHQCISSTPTSTLSTTDVPDVPTSFIESSSDWRSTPNDDLWQGVNGTNNPCPDGFRVPTAAEWTTEHSNWMTQDPEGAFDSPLKLPLTGFRDGSSATYISPSFFPQGSYWSSTVNVTTNNAFRLYFQHDTTRDDNITVIESEKANGYAIRCIKHMP